MIRYVLPALLALAVPAAALNLDRETEKHLFATLSNKLDMNEVVSFEVVVSLCAEVKRTSKADTGFRMILIGYRVTPPDVLGLRAYLRDEVARVNADPREDARYKPIASWCDGARKA
ncbi:hypothetical protein [Methylobacterium sp. Leaf100]|uniref:hypothetical protein n=1 Tax=Methylobacterium sp. Leaf100 TaxID=1736252 RepID=UPI0006FAC989|nr:hypothetical protein [Methylobacterium sp. Leaf100]KQP32809.1 hypothetical protein ASF25_17470 [Methylobacterium sp. Leaf100]